MGPGLTLPWTWRVCREVGGLEFGHDGGGADAAGVGDAPARTAPAADGGVGEDEEGGFVFLPRFVAVAEESVLVVAWRGKVRFHFAGRTAAMAGVGGENL